MEIIEDLVKRHESLMAERNVAQQEWEIIESLVTPYRGRFFKDEKEESSVEWSREEVYDSTAVAAHQNLAARLHGALSNPSIRWFEIRFRDEDLNKNKQVAEWLTLANERIYYALQDSNFNLEVNETYQDICGFGTSALFLESSTKDPLMFKSIWLKEFCFETAWDGSVLRFYRSLEMTPAEIISKFGDDVPQEIKDMEAAGKQAKQDVLFVIYPRNNKIIPLDQVQRADRRPWAYCYILKSQLERLGKEGGYYDMPVFIPRWRKTNSSIWGNSPAHLALSDIKSLNRARRIQLEGSEKKIDPPIFAEERALISDLDMSAAALNVVRKLDGVQPFDNNFDLFVSDAMVSQLQMAVKEYFFYDQLQLPEPQGTPATAYEISVRYEQMQKLLGPTLGRLQNDLLDPVISRTFRLLVRQGQIPDPPPVVIEAGAEFEVEYVGALSAAQKADRAASIERYAVSMANMSTVMPDVLDVIDQAEVSRQLARDLGVPANVLRGEEEVEELQEERREKMAQAEEAALASATGTAMQDMGEGRATLSGEGV